MTAPSSWIIRSVFVCLALVCFTGIARAQFQPRMGLVGPGVGWAVRSHDIWPPGKDDHLFWTNDDGDAWTDITPHDPASREIAGVFFLDASRGWVLLALKHEWPKNSQEPDTFITDIRGFDLASTTDGGASWTIGRLTALPEGVGWGAGGEIFFLDATHGWMSIASPSHQGGEGVLLATTDGGVTWKEIVEVNGGGGYGRIRFTDPLNGWIAGGPGDQYLYATNDGGRHWREVAVPAPSAISRLFEDAAALYASPRFGDSRQGFLPVMYSGSAKSGEGVNILALFSTNDGGHNWHLESWVNLDQATNFPIVAIVDSTAVAPKRLDHVPPTLLKLGPRGKLTETQASASPEVPSGAALLSLNFSDAGHGWASSSNGRLLSTADGGVTWKDITPGGKKTSMLAPSNSTTPSGSSGTPLQSSVAASPASGPSAASSTITTYKSRHIGFDLCQAPPSSPQMSSWWSSSPYFDIGIYVGGSTRSCSQPNLSASWVKSVTTQGWGLIPLWPGPQAPCTTGYATYISTSGGAYAQGQAEADAATSGSRSAMGKLGLGSGSVIYYDIENYSPSATCSGNPTGSYVNAFLSGWVSEIHKNGYIAGIYGNPAPATDWYSGSSGYGPVSPSPDDVWIAKGDNRVTIWGLTLTDAAWPQNQRMHQYFSNQTNTSETWGGQPLVIDKDIEDADVTGGNGTKGYSFNYTTIYYPGGLPTALYGINDAGKIVGYYGDSTQHLHAFLYDGGNFTIIDFPNATQTIPFAINNAGDIVGQYHDQLNVQHGFLLQAGNYTTLDYPNATTTSLHGINDDGQISGSYTDSIGVGHGLIYQNGQFTPINYPGALGTGLVGINGDGEIIGGASFTSGGGVTFLYVRGTFTTLPLDGASVINNNHQIIGNLSPNMVFDHEGTIDTIAPPGIILSCGYNFVSGLNDFTLNANAQNTAKVEIVGGYCPASGGFTGFTATSQ